MPALQVVLINKGVRRFMAVAASSCEISCCRCCILRPWDPERNLAWLLHEAGWSCSLKLVGFEGCMACKQTMHNHMGEAVCTDLPTCMCCALQISVSIAGCGLKCQPKLQPKLPLSVVLAASYCLQVESAIVGHFYSGKPQLWSFHCAFTGPCSTQLLVTDINYVLSCL